MQTKICIVCKEDKDIKKYSIVKGTGNYLNRCRSCVNLAAAKRAEINKDKIDASHLLHKNNTTPKKCIKCEVHKPENTYLIGTRGGISRVCTTCVYKIKRDKAGSEAKAQRKKQFEELVELLGTACAICKNQANVIDHCHTTGEVRGILCKNCNTAIGMLNDDPTLITEALAYVSKEDRYGLFWHKYSRTKRYEK